LPPSEQREKVREGEAKRESKKNRVNAKDNRLLDAQYPVQTDVRFNNHT